GAPVVAEVTTRTEEIPTHGSTSLPRRLQVESPPMAKAADVTNARAVPRISPRALRRATELGVDWTQLSGTGRTGRIHERDVLAAARGHPTQARKPKTPFSLLNKVTVVTGAASGIGAAIAGAFAEAGGMVYVADL